MTTTKTTTKALHEALLNTLASDKFADGTYDLINLKPVEFDKGYQVTFCQIGDDYTEEEYDFLVAMFTEVSSDGTVYAGKFESEPEISFHVNSRNASVKLAVMFNQISIWDWETGSEIKTGGTGTH